MVCCAVNVERNRIVNVSVGTNHLPGNTKYNDLRPLVFSWIKSAYNVFIFPSQLQSNLISHHRAAPLQLQSSKSPLVFGGDFWQPDNIRNCKQKPPNELCFLPMSQGDKLCRGVRVGGWASAAGPVSCHHGRMVNWSCCDRS